MTIVPVRSLSDEDIVRNCLIEFLNEKDYDDCIIEYDSYDRSTNQLFVTEVGEWTDERRRELEAYIKQGFGKRIYVSTMIYG